LWRRGGRTRRLDLDRRRALEVEGLRFGGAFIATRLRTRALHRTFRGGAGIARIAAATTTTATRTAAAALTFGALWTVRTRHAGGCITARGASRSLLHDRRQRNHRGAWLILLRRRCRLFTARELLWPRLLLRPRLLLLLPLLLLLSRLLLLLALLLPVRAAVALATLALLLVATATVATVAALVTTLLLLLLLLRAPLAIAPL
jgi:hypothetical protein